MSKHIVEMLKANKDFQEGNYSKALHDTFIAMDKRLLTDVPESKSQGSTATTVLITADKIFCANAGDSRTVASKDYGPLNGGSWLELSHDHKPENEAERQRIEAAGGTVREKRVDGQLAVSRSFGDYEFKDVSKPPEESKVIAVPDVKEIDRAGIDFVFLACDGVWEHGPHEEPLNDKSS